MSLKEKVEDIYELVDQAERYLSRALRAIESEDLDDILSDAYLTLQKAYQLLRRARIEISDEVDGLEEV